MWLELFIWFLNNGHPERIKRRVMTFLGLSLLILLPLFILNMQMSQRGFKPSLPSFNIEAADPEEQQGLDEQD